MCLILQNIWVFIIFTFNVNHLFVIKRPQHCYKKKIFLRWTRLVSRLEITNISFLWIVAFYFANIWVILKTTRRKMEAFETWCCIRTLKSPWINKIRNVVVYLKMNETNEINVEKNFREKKVDRIYNEKQFIDDNKIIDERIERKTGRDELRTQFMKQIIKDIEKNSYIDLNVTIVDRDAWKAVKLI